MPGVLRAPRGIEEICPKGMMTLYRQLKAQPCGTPTPIYSTQVGFHRFAAVPWPLRVADVKCNS